ncbi:MAG: hypothetical protein DCC67_16905, partial [Planctomycetota bacterium]
MAVFLQGIQVRPVDVTGPAEWQPAQMALGQGHSALEVVAVRTTRAPAARTVRTALRERNNRRAAPLLLVVLHDGQATLCGPAGDEPPIYQAEAGQVERLCREALAQPDRHAVLRLLRDALPSLESRLPYIINQGFLATYELEVGARRHAAWDASHEHGRRLLGREGNQLLRGLGFHIERCDQATSLLRASAGGRRLAVAVLLDQTESPEMQTPRFTGLSPVSYALAVADRENVPYVVVLQGSKIRLYPVKVGVGVGRRGRTETFVEVHAGLLRETDAAYLWMLFSADALDEGGTLEALLEESKRFAGSLAERLRERIYDFVIPPLAEGLARARGLRRFTPEDLAVTYEMAMTVLFRLLFIAYGEDKDLLPYKRNSLYQARSLKHKAQELLEIVSRGAGDRAPPSAASLEPNTLAERFDDGDSWWEEITRLFRAVDQGHAEWAVPKYNGGLFSRDPSISRVGQLLAEVTLPNKVLGPVLANLLLIGTPEGIGPVDFRSLGVREFGTIYEGLLESELGVAETDLALDANGFYRPAREGETPVVQRRHIYLHNKSGARKSTGAYFTKPFAVEHLLEHALEPALSDHAARLDQLDEADAAEALFDFRVADIAMGSRHFLVAAVDHIERALSQYLSRRRLPGVQTELAQLRSAAVEALGPLAEQIEIEDTQLLRRLIARRCIYGVDLNPVSVNLARLSIWIHTFVPGLPLSLLNHNLVAGNSLVGIGRVEEIIEYAQAEDRPLFDFDAHALVGEAMEPLVRLARIADATPADLRRAREAYEAAEAAVAPAKALCDIVTASRMAGDALPLELEEWDELRGTIVDSRFHKKAKKALAGLDVLHFPAAFPEVFLRERSGFDVILGNPPWEKTQVEDHEFWARHHPGLRGISQRQRERITAELRKQRTDLVALLEREHQFAERMRSALLTGPYPGMNASHPDLYKAFCWRFWKLASPQGGQVAVVLPRSAWNSKGTAEFRLQVLQDAELVDLTMLVNNRQWVFPEVHPQYTIALAILKHGQHAGTRVNLRGPYPAIDRFTDRVRNAPATFAGEEIASWTDTASLPLLPTDESLEVFQRLRSAPRLDSNDSSNWRIRPVQGDLNSTTGKPMMDLESDGCPAGFWPVYKGESFDLWQPDSGTYYAWADPAVVTSHLQDKRRRGRKLRSSAYFEFQHDRPAAWWNDPHTLPCYGPRIAFRDVTRATDSRTIRAALVPPRVFVNHKAPYLILVRGSEAEEAYLLGLLSSLQLDWYARRFVENSMAFFILAPFPVPRPPVDAPLRRRTIALAGRLAAADDRFAAWAAAVGVECGPLDAAAKFDHICELDAVVAHLYGLQERHLVHIFETFHEGWEPGAVADHPTLGDYNQRLGETLEHFRRWRSNIRQ